MKKRYYARRRKPRRKAKARFFVIVIALIAVLATGIYFIVTTKEPGSAEPPSESVVLTPPDTDNITLIPEEEQPTEEPTPTPAPSLATDLIPSPIAKTEPSYHNFTTKLMDNGVEVDSYTRPETITFGSAEEYTDLEGVITFRGNNYRNAPSWGTANIVEEKLELIRYKETSRIGNWGGSGWTGQPLIVKWPEQTKQNMMTLYDEFKAKPDFVEVIYATLDGRIYFMDLETGDKTRDFIKIGAPTKGTASLDPRGYPIIYVGQGLNPEGSGEDYNDMYFRAYSLIDNELLMEFGASSRDPFALRKNWQAYDSSALIDDETDTLIVPGESGVIYTAKLNTVYNETAGTVTMDMDPVKVKYNYTTPRNESVNRWGIENSAVAWREYLIFTDNIGMLQCLNLNSMELVYANDLTDDSDVSMVLEEDTQNNTFYLYTGCEYDEKVRKNGSSGTAYARKLNGITGEVIWEQEYTVKSGSVDGGVLASPVLGREGTSMAGLIIFNVTQEVKGDSTTSRLVALDKLTGELKWEYDMDFAGWSPSSPVPVYTEEGKGYIVQCDRAGDIALIDGATGVAVDVVNVRELTGEDEETFNNFEATPAVYGNTIVVGTRKQKIFFIEIK